jgi:hypothetical protein
VEPDTTPATKESSSQPKINKGGRK